MAHLKDSAEDFWPTKAPDVRELERPEPEVHCPVCNQVWTLEDAVSGGRWARLAWHRYCCRFCEEGIPVAIRRELKLENF